MGTESLGEITMLLCALIVHWMEIYISHSLLQISEPPLLQSLAEICPLYENSLLMHTVWEDE